LLERNTNILYYITNENIYDVLQDVHLRIGHDGKHCMNNEVKKNIKNITQETVFIYLKFCKSYQSKQKSKSKGLVIKPMEFSEMNSRCQVNLIDM